MHAVEVRDHIMIAHSFPAEVFGPAQGVHGATFTVDLAFYSETIDQYGMVVDIGLALEALSDVLTPLKYKNLDDVPEFAGKFTTTEFLCHHIFEAMAARVPVITTRIAGIPELVEDGVAGRLVPPGNLEALVQAIKDGLGDPGAAKAMGAAGRAKVEAEFDIAKEAAKIAGMFKT